MLSLLVALALCAAPAAAAPAGAVQPSIAAAAQARVAALPVATLAQQTTTAGRPAGKPFFKTRKGALAGALLVAALGYTVYSFGNDRVKSPAR